MLGSAAHNIINKISKIGGVLSTETSLIVDLIKEKND